MKRMSRKSPAYYVALLVLLQATLVGVLLQFQNVTQRDISFTPKEGISTEYVALYNASLLRLQEGTYEDARFDFTPTAIALNSIPSTTLDLKNAASFAFVIGIILIIGAHLLSVTTFIDSPEDRLPAMLVGVPLILLSYPFLIVIERGNIYSVVVFLIACGLFLLRKDKTPIFAGVIFSVATGLSIHPIPVLLGLFALRRSRVIIGFFIGLLFQFAVAPGLWIEYLSTRWPAIQSGFSWHGNAGVRGLISFAGHGFSAIDQVPETLLQVGAVAGCLLLFGFVVVDFIHSVDNRTQTENIAALLPLTFVIPRTVTPDCMILLLPLVSMLAARWCAAEPKSKSLKIALVVGLAGITLANLHVTALEQVTGVLALHYITGLGALLTIISMFWIKCSSIQNKENGSEKPTWTMAWQYAFKYRLLLIAVFLIPGLFMYYSSGYSLLVLILWLVPLIIIGKTMAHDDNEPIQMPRGMRPRDAGVAILLTAFFFPLYLTGLHEVPFQINTDELVLIEVVKRLTNQQAFDPLGLDQYYFNFPAGCMIFSGMLCKAIGGITFDNVRIVNGVMGLLCIPTAYFLFRIFWPRNNAAIGAAMFGASHVLIGVSRMCNIINLPLLLMMIATGLLFAGVRTNRRALLYFGGVVAGIGMYNYVSARAIPIVCFGFLFFYWICSRRTFDLKKLMGVCKPALLGFLLASAPMIVATIKTPKDGYVKQQLVIFPEGQELVRFWENTQDTKVALISNTSRGLLAFNSNSSDRALCYINPGYGFVDPLTGILLWIGVLRIALKKLRRPSDILAAVGLFLIWLPLSFLTTKNPSFPRMLVLLPFVVYLAIQGARFSIALIGRVARNLLKARVQRVLVTCIVLCTVLINIRIFFEHSKSAVRDGDIPGATVRHVMAHSTDPGHTFYVGIRRNDDPLSYFWFGNEAWERWLKMFTSESQQVFMLDPYSLVKAEKPEEMIKEPATLFVHDSVWKKCKEKLIAAYPNFEVYGMSPNRMHLAVVLRR